MSSLLLNRRDWTICPDTKSGVLGDVVADGPAAKAGRKSGDVVLRYNGRAVENANELRYAVAAMRANTRMTRENVGRFVFVAVEK